MDFKLRIHCDTYNHSAFIENAMNGFVLQKTDSPFVAVIFDDASTDSTQDVILTYLHNNFKVDRDSEYYERDEEYAKIYFAQHKENENCFFAVYLSKYNHYSIKKDREPYFEEWAADYVALCEGDDYWTDPYKLQNQVDFLEANPDYSMCFHNAEFLYDCPSNLEHFLVEDRDYEAPELFEHWVVPTASILIKRDSFDIICNPRLLNGDIYVVLSAATSGKVRGISAYMSVYRIHENGVTVNRHKQDELDLQRKYVDHYRFIYEQFPQITRRKLKSKLSSTYYNLGWIYWQRQQPVHSLFSFAKSFSQSPLQFARHAKQYIGAKFAKK